MKVCIKCNAQLTELQRKYCNECRIFGKQDHSNRYSRKNREKCWSLNNLRPYSAKQNILDGIYKVRHNRNMK